MASRASGMLLKYLESEANEFTFLLKTHILRCSLPFKEHVSSTRLCNLIYTEKVEERLQRSRHHELLIHRRQWIKSMTWSKCLKIPEFHIPNVTFGKHEPRTHKPKADEMFATASSRHLKSFPSSGGKILWGQVLGFYNCSRLLLQIRTNQKARTQDRQTAPSPRWAARLSFSKSGCSVHRRIKALYQRQMARGTNLLQRTGLKFMEVSNSENVSWKMEEYS